MDSKIKAPTPLRFYLAILITPIAILISIIFSLHTGVHRTEVTTPWVNAAMGAYLEATIAHLWLEELIGGDPHIEASLIFQHLEKSHWYASAMTEGGRDSSNTIAPLKDSLLRAEARSIQKTIGEIQSIARQRLALPRESGAGTEVDHRLDSVFTDLQIQSLELEEGLSSLISRDVANLEILQISLISTCFLLAVIVSIILIRYQKQREYDIMCLKHTEDRLRESEKQKDAILDASIDLILYVDTDMRIIWANREALKVVGFGKPGDMTGRKCHEVYMNSEDPCPHCPCKMSIQSGKVEHSTFELKGHAGTDTTWWENYGVPVRDELGCIVGIIEINRNITERKRSEELIYDAIEEEKQRLGRDLHDGLVQHLSGIFYLNQAKNEMQHDTDADQAGISARITDLLGESIEQARGLARGLCPVGLETDGLDLAINRLVGAQNAIFPFSISYKTIHADTEKSENTEHRALPSDAVTCLYRIVQEAISNATRHSSPKNVRVELVRSQNHTTLSIRDDGVGIAFDSDGENGMGLHTMSYRAKRIGAQLSICRLSRGGTEVRCILNHEDRKKRDDVDHAHSSVV